MRHLVLWSGGVESTSLLKHLLSNIEDDVVAHHIHRQNQEGRLVHETQAVNALLPHLQAIRRFEFSTSSVSICDGQATPYDFAIDYPIGIVAMRHHRCDVIYRAGCAEDDWDHSTHNGVITVTNPNPSEPGFSHRRRAKTLAPLLYPYEDPNKVAPWLAYYGRPKHWHWRFLGDLAPLTWSCRRPMNGKECGTCHACLERSAAKLGTSWISDLR